MDNNMIKLNITSQLSILFIGYILYKYIRVNRLRSDEHVGKVLTILNLAYLIDVMSSTRRPLHRIIKHI